MQQTTTLTAEVRDHGGRGQARATRRAGRVPGIVYGGQEDPAMVSVGLTELARAMNAGGFTNRLYDLVVAGKKQRVLPREVQLDPVSDTPLHVDFLRLSADAEITIMVPTEFVNEEEAPGIKRGGVINVVRHQIEVRCRADAIPEIITIDLTGFDIGDSIHMSHVSLPDGVSPTITDRDFTIATIAAPTVFVEEVEETEEEIDLEGEAIEGEGEGEGTSAEDTNSKEE